MHAVVVGSGFGGSVAAYRLASADREVVVLERGHAYPPGSFPRTPAELGRAFWDPSEGQHGMFDVWSFPGIDGIVSSGLGGGSLVYANVLLRKDERWFTTASPVPGGGYEHWPVTRGDLEPHYEAVEQMLGATPYPYEATTAKTRELHAAADRLGLEWQLPPLAVSFAPAPGQAPLPGAPLVPPAYGNLHGLPRRTCRLCGECDLGCNDGAKNTLDHTYLSAAAAAGADLRTGCEVRGFSPLPGGGYQVRYVRHDPQAQGQRTRTDRLPLHTITCDRLVLAAGAFGTTYLLLRNRAAFPGLSRALGSRFSGNGDLLTFVLGAREADGRPRPLQSSRGPVITSAVRVADRLDGGDAAGRGYYVEDAGLPVFAEWLVEATQVPGALGRGARFAATRLARQLHRSPKTGLSADLAALLGAATLSSSSLPLLGMGRDIPDGTLRLRRGHLDLDWTTTTSRGFFDAVRSTMAALADELGGHLADNPLWWRKRVVTVHPLGGAPMGRHVAEGVADAQGEVFGFPGLHVLDGSLLPGPVGANPSLTIAAVADRACDHLLQSAVPTQRRPADVPVPPEPVPVAPHGGTSLSFREQMKGFVALDVADPVDGARRGRSLGQRLAFRLTITVDDVERFVADPSHPGRAEGEIDCDVLGGRLPVERGWFNLFTRDDDPRRRRMLYRLWSRDPGGNPFTLAGVKDVVDDDGVDVWRDTSTLSVRLVHGHVLAEDEGADAAPIGAGVITIHLPDFLQQLTTFRAEGPDPAGAVQAFARLFLGQLWEVYGPRLQEVSR